MPENAFQKEKKKKKKEELRHQNQEVKQAYHRKQVTYIIIYTTYDVLLIVRLPAQVRHLSKTPCKAGRKV